MGGEIMKKAIYKITNNVNKKVYIGQSVNPEKRFEQHCYRHENYKSLINDAIQKYGKNNFSLEIIGWFEDYNDKEKYYINFYRSKIPFGYNIAPGGEEPPVGKGEANSNSKISSVDAANIIKDLQNWDIPRKAIIQKYKITYDIMRHINEGDSWRQNELEYPIRPTEKVINDWRANQVIDLLKTIKPKVNRQKVGFNRSAVTMINIGKNHYNPNLDYPIRK